MAGPPGESRRPDYRTARIGAAAGLTAALIGLLFIDAASSSYDANPFTLGILAAMILGLLGLEAREILSR